MKFLTITTLIIPFLTGCEKIKKPVVSQVVSAKALSKNVIGIKSYEVPKGIFRGTLWPSETRRNFQIWIIDGKKDYYFDIPAPKEFGKNVKEVTKKWIFEVKNNLDNKITYLASRKDGSKSIQIELPLKKRKYNFSVLNNSSGEEILIFMDISENIIDTGLFGYIVIKKGT